MEPELQFSGDNITYYEVYIGQRVLEQDESTDGTCTTQTFDVSLIRILYHYSEKNFVVPLSVLIILPFSQETEGSLTITFTGVPRGSTFIDAYLQVIKTLHICC